jgi:hypothetical protein
VSVRPQRYREFVCCRFARTPSTYVDTFKQIAFYGNEDDIPGSRNRQRGLFRTVCKLRIYCRKVTIERV